MPLVDRSWADLIKCDHPVHYCPSPLFPSIKVLDKFHYSGLRMRLQPSNVTTVEDVFDAAEGNAHELLDDVLRTFATTQSIWSSNFMLRFLLHVFGDIHQPLHATSSV